MGHEERIYRYLNGLMSKEEIRDLEAELAINERLKSLLTMEQTIYHGIEQYGRSQFKQRVNSIMLKERRRSRIRKALLVALALLMALLAVYWWMSPAPVEKHTPQEIFAKHFEMPVLGSTQRSSNGVLELEQRVKAAYQTQQYSTVLQLIQDAPNTDWSPETSIIIGVSALEEGKPEDAIQNLSQVQTTEVAYYDHAQWYLAMTYLKQGKVDQARAIIQPMVSDVNHDHHQDAREIFKFLKK